MYNTNTKLATIPFVIAVLFLFSVTSTNSMATEDEGDCFNTGYRDGRDHPFDHAKYEECKAAASSYYHGFINGCISVEGNTHEICESEQTRCIANVCFLRGNT